MVVPARPRRHRSLVTLSRLLPFPLKEAAAPGAQRTRRVSPVPGTLRCPHHPPTCPHATEPLPARPRPHHIAGMGGRCWWVDDTTSPDWETSHGQLGCPTARPHSAGRASPSQAPLEQEHKEPSGKAVKQGPRCSTPPVTPQRKWTGMASPGCSSQPRDTWFSPPFTKKTSFKETSAQGPGFFTEPFTITRASTSDQSLSAEMQNPCFFPHPMRGRCTGLGEARRMESGG